jgi:hypothetical protein
VNNASYDANHFHRKVKHLSLVGDAAQRPMSNNAAAAAITWLASASVAIEYGNSASLGTPSMASSVARFCSSAGMSGSSTLPIQPCQFQIRYADRLHRQQRMIQAAQAQSDRQHHRQIQPLGDVGHGAELADRAPASRRCPPPPPPRTRADSRSVGSRHALRLDANAGPICSDMRRGPQIKDNRD